MIRLVIVYNDHAETVPCVNRAAGEDAFNTAVDYGVDHPEDGVKHIDLMEGCNRLHSWTHVSARMEVAA